MRAPCANRRASRRRRARARLRGREASRLCRAGRFRRCRLARSAGRRRGCRASRRSRARERSRCGCGDAVHCRQRPRHATVGRRGGARGRAANRACEHRQGLRRGERAGPAFSRGRRCGAAGRLRTQQGGGRKCIARDRGCARPRGRRPAAAAHLWSRRERQLPHAAPKRCRRAPIAARWHSQSA